MKTKQELIQEEWGIYWDELKQFIDENGWISWGYRGSFGDKNPASLADMYKYCGGQENHQSKNVTIPERTTLFRPKSLSGIENNNGWIHIESESDLPKDISECFVYDDDGDITYYTFGLKEDDFKTLKDQGVTHYQHIIKPNKPLY